LTTVNGTAALLRHRAWPMADKRQCGRRQREIGSNAYGNLRERTVSPDLAIMKATDTITVVEGYDAVRFFLEIIWRREGKTAGEIELLIGRLKWADGSPVDPLIWEDWLAAVQIACSGRTE
jgi:hypothetical protein